MSAASIAPLMYEANAATDKVAPKPAKAFIALLAPPLIDAMALLTVFFAASISFCKRATLAAISIVRVPIGVLIFPSSLGLLRDQ